MFLTRDLGRFDIKTSGKGNGKENRKCKITSAGVTSPQRKTAVQLPVFAITKENYKSGQAFRCIQVKAIANSVIISFQF